MCGIAGTYGRERVDTDLLLAMAGELAHRGPDGVGVYADGPYGMVNTRLAIVDLAGGDQPLSDERGRFWVMQNGEIYNHVELRADLAARGHRFETTSDTEVIAHAFEEWGIDCLARFNGDFAIAIWDRARRELVLARDRFGIRPLFLAEWGEDVCFASEAKALLRHPRARRELDPLGIVETFTMWANLPDRSAFAGVRELPPAHYVVVARDGIGEPKRWWNLEFQPSDAPEDELIDEVEALLVDATRLRLRADVPVAAYLSGGLDSSALAAIGAREVGNETLHAFGVGFSDERFDESAPQDAIAAELGVDFQRTNVDAAAIHEVFPRVVALAEKPILRTAPAPLLLLSRAVREAGLKVVITGEGADEMFAGYDIFREDKVRRFWARDPESSLRPLLFARLNRWLGTAPERAGGFLARFYAQDLLAVDDPLYSHRLRFTNTARLLRLLDPELVARAGGAEAPANRLERALPASFASLSALAKAQYLEQSTFLEGYLLHSQGDRMLMANSIEGRFPYLDYRVAELAARLPDSLRLRGLREKYALRRAVERYLPPQIRERPKVPYRAPIGDVFFGGDRGDQTRALLDARRVADAGLLEPKAVERLVHKFTGDGRRAVVGETDEMALVGSASLMLLHEQLVASPRPSPAAQASRVVVGDGVVGAPAAVAVAGAA